MAKAVVDDACMDNGWAEVSVEGGRVWLTVKEGMDGQVGGRVAIVSMDPHHAVKISKLLSEAASKAMDTP